ncbi:hypothetical protein ZTR_09008 [Talaromyces verruculosus]|nr:hypothetical protein ZTR_09008 [Talaromyces verruculosus]
MMSASIENPPDCLMWHDALTAKYDGIGEFGRKEWDQLLGDCQAVCDWPACAFAKELIEAYPQAKVILTTRDVNSWHSLVSKFSWAASMYYPMLNKFFDTFFRGDFPNQGKEVYMNHLKEVRSLVPPEKLLEFNISEGWGPLCEFLGHDIPQTPFPHSNEVSDFIARSDVEHFHASNAYEIGDLGGWPQQLYKSSPMIGPVLNYIHESEQCNNNAGYTMITPRGNSVPVPGPMIIDDRGDLIWTKHYGSTYDLKVQQYRGKDYLTFWVGKDLGGHGSGSHYMLDSSYREAYVINGSNGQAADFHDFLITKDSTAVYTVYSVVEADLSSLGGPEKGYIIDCGFQEIDVESQSLRFEWWASDHFTIDEAYHSLQGSGTKEEMAWDWFHINSVDKHPSGNFLISSRYMKCLAYVNGATGDIIWKLGGKNNMFTDLSDGGATNISYQHDAHFRDNGTAIALLDNAARGINSSAAAPDDNISRGLYLEVDVEKLVAKVRQSYWSSEGIISISQGSIQVLEDENRVILGYGLLPIWVEFTLDGRPLCEVHFGPRTGYATRNIISYRLTRYPWIGKPLTSPDIVVEGDQVYVSWNGATEISTWVLESAEYSSSLNERHQQVMHSQPKDGFETIIKIPEDNTYSKIRVRALDADGATLGSTRVVEVKMLHKDEQSLFDSVPWLLMGAAVCVSMISVLGILPRAYGERY